MMFTFFRFQSEIPFLGKFGPKTRDLFFKVKFGTKTYMNVQKWWCSLSLFSTGSILLGQIWSKKSKLSVGLRWNLVPRPTQYAEFKNTVHVFPFQLEKPFDGDVHFFCFRPFLVSFEKYIWHFDTTWLISQQLIRRYLKPMAFLVFTNLKAHLTSNFTINELLSRSLSSVFPGNIYFFKVNNKNGRKRCEICSKLTIKTPLGQSFHYLP